jgi:hypothetical protein
LITTATRTSVDEGVAQKEAIDHHLLRGVASDRTPPPQSFQAHQTAEPSLLEMHISFGCVTACNTVQAELSIALMAESASKPPRLQQRCRIYRVANRLEIQLSALAACVIHYGLDQTYLISATKLQTVVHVSHTIIFQFAPAAKQVAPA